MNVCTPGNCICDAREWEGDTDCFGNTATGDKLLARANHNNSVAAPDQEAVVEPQIITIEPCNRFFIVEQRWGSSTRLGQSDSIGRPTEDDPNSFETAYIYNPIAGPYARVYREWCRMDNRRNFSKPRFAYIVEARTRRQVVNRMVALGHTSMYNGQLRFPEPTADSAIANNTTILQQENTMFNNIPSGESLANLQNTLLMQAAALQEQIDYVNSLPKEPTPSDDKPNIVYFQKKFGNSKAYDYAAIKAGDGKWYTTGPRTPKGFTWDELVRWIYNDDKDAVIYRAKKLDVLS